jgi:hypothetical protein
MDNIKVGKEFMKADEKDVKITRIEPVNYQFGINYNFDVGYAQKYGINEAIFLQNLIFWLRQNKANDKNIHGGKVYTYNTQKSYITIFPFWSEPQIKRIIKSLVVQKVIEIKHFKHRDHTNYYTLCNEKMLGFNLESTKSSIPLDENVHSIESTKSSIPLDENVHSIESTKSSIYITDNNTDNKQHIEEIYNLYPSKDKNNNNRSTSKSLKDKEKIKNILKSKSFVELKNIVELYLKECGQNHTYLKNFSVLLNRLPDYSQKEIEPNKPQKIENYYYKETSAQPLPGWGLE